MSFSGDFHWRPYVSVAERRRIAAREMEKRRKQGHPVSPIVIEGRAIAKTFWGKSWCENLEKYSDYANRLPRGRTYVRNGSVVDLQIAAGQVSAQVSGSELYRVELKVAGLPKARWQSICADCAGGIDSLVELLQGRFSQGVMQRLCQQGKGLFPSPSEITLSCSCPDWASVCKHVAAVFYGIGARLDDDPLLLFKLRQVNEQDLIRHADLGLPLLASGMNQEKLLVDDSLSELFGIDLSESAAPQLPPLAADSQPPRAAALTPAAQSKETARRRSTKAKAHSQPPKAAALTPAAQSKETAKRPPLSRIRTKSRPQTGDLTAEAPSLGRKKRSAGKSGSAPKGAVTGTKFDAQANVRASAPVSGVMGISKTSTGAKAKRGKGATEIASRTAPSRVRHRLNGARS